MPFSTWLAELEGVPWHRLPAGAPCNNGCVFCHETDLRQRHAPRSPEDQARIPGMLSALEPGTGVVFGLGEPALMPAITEHLRLAKERGLRPWLLTNGRAMSMPQRAGAVLPWLEGIVVALHGQARIHEEITRVPRSHHQTLTGLRTLLSLRGTDGPRVGVLTVLTNENAAAFPNLALDFGAGKPDFWVIRQQHPLGRGKERLDEGTPSMAPARLAFLTLERHRALLPPVLIEDVPPCVLGDELSGRVFGGDLPWAYRLRQGRLPWSMWLSLDKVDFERIPACDRCARQRTCPGVMKPAPTLAGTLTPLPTERWSPPPLPLAPDSSALASAESMIGLTLTAADRTYLHGDGFRESRERFPAWRRQWRVPLERILLAAGHKPAFRHVLSEAALEGLRAEADALGLMVLVSPEPVYVNPGNEFLYGEGFLDEFSTRLPRYLGTERPLVAGRRVVAAIGADVARLERLLALDQREREAWKQYGGVEGLSAEIGRLLGYPECCIGAYSETGVGQNRALVERAALRSSVFHWELNHLSRTVFSLIDWQPCSYDCTESLAWARRAWELMREEDSAIAWELREFLARPRLYLDDRCQVIVEGRCELQNLFIDRAWTPAHLDRSRESAALDAVFEASFARLLRGQSVELRDHSYGQRRTLPVPADRRLIWLPFEDRLKS